ncbi:MAG TPA: MauE/DoxX family redox-associated membrane protein [Solirubrobacteraceae bacterium]|nr:MauE/DoxX family redox-associated membrane protein [Solirubrobacteraceae bacterium]
MLHVAVRLALAAVLLGAAAAKLRRPTESRAALAGLLGAPRWRRGAPAAWAPLGTVVAAELTLAAGVAAGLDAAALAAAAFLVAGAMILVRALRAGRAGAPCGCFGARSRVSRGAVVRAGLLAAGFAALPLVPRTDPSAETWLAIGLAVALAGVAALGVAVLALAREVGMLRLAVGPQGALEVAGEGPELGTDSGLAAHLDPRVGNDGLGLAVFTSEGCGMCRRLAPGIQAFARHPNVALLELDEVRDAEHWRRLNVPGSPYALALDARGRVLAKGTFNSLAQLESVLAAAERRQADAARA